MALPYKQDKVALVVKEMVNTGAEYEINGIDTEKSIFLWRREQELYDVIPTSSYNIDKTSSDTKLIITDLVKLAEMERLQVITVINDTSSKYEPLLKVDTTILKNSYNELVENFQSLFNYIKKTVMIADGQDFSVVLPTLNEGEVWVKTAEGWKGFQIGKLEQEIQVLLKQITDATTQALQDIENSKNSALLGITNTGNGQNTRIIDQGNTQSTRLNSIDTEVSTKLDLMQRMMSVIVGANRWLDGGNIATRDINNLERTADGGDITQRVGLPNRIYDAGDITQRVVNVPLEIDLGQK